jgi:hypothetical protein
MVSLSLLLVFVVNVGLVHIYTKQGLTHISLLQS